MIFNFIIDAMFSLFSWAINLFPDANPAVATFIQHAIYNIKLPLAAWNWIFPVDDFYFCLNVMFVLLLAQLTFTTVRWILSIVTLNLIH